MHLRIQKEDPCLLSLFSVTDANGKHGVQQKRFARLVV
jgi:hypothetical protein